MGLETGTKISELNALWPLDTDKVDEGSAHLRLLKTVLKGLIDFDFTTSAAQRYVQIDDVLLCMGTGFSSANGDTVITFARTFDDIPDIAVTPISNSVNTRTAHVLYGTPTFAVAIFLAGGAIAAMKFSYIAIGKAA